LFILNIKQQAQWKGSVRSVALSTDNHLNTQEFYATIALHPLQTYTIYASKKHQNKARQAKLRGF